MRNILNKLNFYRQKFSSNVTINYHFVIISVFLALSVFGVFYYDFYQIAQSESGIFFYPSYLFQEPLTSWSSYFFGSRNAQSLVYTTFLYRFFITPDFPFPFIVQYSYYFLLVLIGWYGFYKCTSLFFNEKKSIFLLYLSLIYIFNPASASILYRFQYPYITFYFILPLLTYLTFNSFSSKDTRNFLKYTLATNVLLSFYSIVYASIPTLLILFIVFSLVSVYMVFSNFTLRFFLKRILPFFIVWFGLNVYWLVPMLLEFTVKNNLYQSSHVLDLNSNFGNLEFFSNRDSKLFNIFTLYAEEYLNIFSSGITYSKNILIFLSTLPILALSFLTVSYFKRKRDIVDKNIFFILFFLLSSFFLIRGLNYPFSSIYEFLFKEIPVFQIFRNPFEKGILIFAFPFLLIFAFLIRAIYVKLKKRFLAIMILVLYTSPFVFLSLTSNLLIGHQHPFNSRTQGFKIQFPDYYYQIKSTLKNESHDKPLVIPILSEGVTYQWENGYIGQDILHTFLSPHSYSFNSPDRFFDRKIILENIYYANDKNGVLSMYGFDSLVTRSDYDYKSRNEVEPSKVINNFLGNAFFEKEKSIPLNNLIISSSTRKINSVLDGDSVKGDENFFIKSDWQDDIYLKISLEDASTLPGGIPFVLVIDSDDINKINELDIRFGLKESYSFFIKKNEYFCESCFSSEVVHIPTSKNIDSFYLSIDTKKKSQGFKIKNIKIVPITKSTVGLNYSKVLETDKSSLYFINKSPEVISTSKFIVYDNFNFFLSSKIDSNEYTYIQRDDYEKVKDGLNRLDLEKVAVEYQKISESEYYIFLKPLGDGKEVSTILTLMTSVDSFWKLTPPDFSIFKMFSFKEDNLHFLSNTYSNSFIVENIPSEGKLIKLIYLPQVYYNYFLFFSITLWILLFSIALIYKKETKKHKLDK